MAQPIKYPKKMLDKLAKRQKKREDARIYEEKKAQRERDRKFAEKAREAELLALAEEKNQENTDLVDTNDQSKVLVVDDSDLDLPRARRAHLNHIPLTSINSIGFAAAAMGIVLRTMIGPREFNYNALPRSKKGTKSYGQR